jgi:hypothetical protein
LITTQLRSVFFFIKIYCNRHTFHDLAESRDWVGSLQPLYHALDMVTLKAAKGWFYNFSYILWAENVYNSFYWVLYVLYVTAKSRNVGVWGYGRLSSHSHCSHCAEQTQCTITTIHTHSSWIWWGRYRWQWQWQKQRHSFISQ